MHPRAIWKRIHKLTKRLLGRKDMGLDLLSDEERAANKTRLRAKVRDAKRYVWRPVPGKDIIDGQRVRKVEHKWKGCKPIYEKDRRHARRLGKKPQRVGPNMHLNKAQRMCLEYMLAHNRTGNMIVMERPGDNILRVHFMYGGGYIRWQDFKSLKARGLIRFSQGFRDKGRASWGRDYEVTGYGKDAVAA